MTIETWQKSGDMCASDRARMITGVTIDVTAGTTGALNYKVPVTNGKEGDVILFRHRK